MNSLAKDYLKKNRVLINYVRDSNGFKKGVVVAIDANHIGWSLVARDDYRTFRGKLSARPIVHRSIVYYLRTLYEDGLANVDAVTNRLEQLMKKVNGIGAFDAFEVIQEPMFNRNTGLSIAIERAMNDNNQTSMIPYDRDLREALARMIDRASRAFAK